MHVAMINSFYHPATIGGAERSVQILAESMIERNHRVSILCTAQDGLHRKASINGVDVFYRPNANVYNWTGLDGFQAPCLLKPLWHLIDSWNIATYLKTKEWLRATKPELLHTNNLSGFSVAAWSAASSLGIPVVHTIRDYYLTCINAQRWSCNAPCKNTCGVCNFYAIPRKVASQKLSAVVGISHHVLDSHLAMNYFSRVGKSCVIGNSVVTPVSQEKSHKHQSRLVVGYVGRLEPAKGVELLLREFSRLPSDRFELHLYGSGKTDYTSKLKETYATEHIHFQGHRPASDIYPALDLTVVPSLWDEPFGRVIIESFSHGIPVLASNRGGLDELVATGKTGFVFDPTRDGALAECLLKMTPQGCRTYQTACLVEAARFSEAAISFKYEELYSEVL